MNIAIYLRKSRAEENQNTEETLQRHKEQLLKFAYDNNHNIIKIYEEVVSGERITNRPQMQALMNDVADEKYDAVLCMDIDRLGRGSMAEQGLIIENFKDSNTLIITPKKTYDLSEETDELSTEFEAFIARMELKKIKKRMNVGKIKTVTDGYCLAEAPFGYERDYIKGKPTLKVNEAQAKIVKLIFDMYTKENMGCQKVANYLNSINQKTRKGTEFSRNSVRHILKNEIYVGNVIYNKISYKMKDGKKVRKCVNPRDEWIIGKGTFPHLISDEQFAEAQAMLSERRTVPTPFNRNPNNPLAGIIICGKCGRIMQKQAYKEQSSDVALRCVTPNCQRGNRFDYVEQEILRQLQNFLDTAFETDKINAPETSDNEKIKIIKNELSKLEKQRASLHNLLEQGVYDPQTFINRNKILSDKILDLNRELKLLTATPENKIIDYDLTKQRIRYVLSVYATADISDKNKYMKSILDKVIYNKDKTARGSNSFELGLYIKYSYK